MRFSRTVLLSIAFTSLLPLCAYGQLRTTGHYAVPLANVTRAITAALSDEAHTLVPLQIVILSDVTATEVSPQLDVASAASMSGHEFTSTDGHKRAVRLTCHVPGTCLPFYAIVIWPANSATTNLSHNAPANDTPGRNDFLIKAGTRLSLMLDDGDSHLELPVFSLESGHKDQSIRVASLGHKRTFKARIVTSTLVQGSF